MPTDRVKQGRPGRLEQGPAAPAYAHSPSSSACQAVQRYLHCSQASFTQSCALTPATAAAQAAWVRFSPLSNTSSSLPRNPSSVTHQVTPVTPGNPSQQGADNSSSRWQGAGSLGAGQQQQQQQEGVSGHPAPGPPDSLVFLQGSRLTAYLPSGEQLTAPLPAPCAAMWPLPGGLLLVVSGALQHQAESSSHPALCMPSDMVCPTCHAYGSMCRTHNRKRTPQRPDNGGCCAQNGG